MWGTQWYPSRECGYQLSREFDSRNLEAVPQMRSVNFARKRNEAEFLDVIVNFSSQIVSMSPAWVARETMKMRPFCSLLETRGGKLSSIVRNSDVALRSVLIVFTRSRPTPPKRTAIQCAERRVEKRMSFRCPPRPHLSVVFRVSAKRVEFLRNSTGTANRNAQICQQSKRSQATAGTFYGQYEGWKAGSQQFLLEIRMSTHRNAPTVLPLRLNFSAAINRRL